MTDTASWSTTGAARVGPDRERRPYPTDARFWISSARWLQRAINAWRAANPGSGGPIEVDGRAGPVTMSAVRDIGPVIPVENYPSTDSVTSQVLIAKTFAAELEQLPFVPDPVASDTESAPVRRTASPAPAAPASAIRPWMWIAGGVGLVLLLVLAGYYFASSESTSSRPAKRLGKVDLVPVPARGDPKGHIATSSLGGMRRGRRKKKP